jgi:tRNA A-37 threonylcarbamoyl transferase component Bud32
MSEMKEGSTGIVHIGTMHVKKSSPTIPVAVKLAFSKKEKADLAEEHKFYSRLCSTVKGVPHDVGLFVEDGPIDGDEGPYALVMTFAGGSLLNREKNVAPSIKLALSVDFINMYSHFSRAHRRSLLATLKAIHRTDVIHRDIHPRNLCATIAEEAFIIDFSHATRSNSQHAKALEVKQLCEILGIKESKARKQFALTRRPPISSRLKAMEEKAEAKKRKAERKE